MSALRAVVISYPLVSLRSMYSQNDSETDNVSTLKQLFTILFVKGIEIRQKAFTSCVTLNVTKFLDGFYKIAPCSYPRNTLHAADVLTNFIFKPPKLLNTKIIVKCNS